MHCEAQIKSQKKDKASEFKKVSCRFCKSEEIIKWGTRKTGRGKVQRYCCQNCKRKFTIDDGFFRMRNHSKKITQALHLYFSGTSLRKTQEHLGIFNSHNCSYVAILNWIRKYSKLVGFFVDKLELEIGSEIQIDEMEFRTKGKRSWFIDCIDTKTRFIISSTYSKKRDNKAISKVVKKAKYKTRNQVKTITTDGFNVYDGIVKGYYGYSRYSKNYQVLHNKNIASQGGGFNHKIERLHNSIGERTKIFRGFGDLESARLIMKGYEIYYNFCRKHQAINKYPYELALPNLVLGKNKWLDLINYAKGGKVYKK